MKVLFTGGGTGGHIIPIIAIARELRRIHPETDLEFFYMGPSDQFDDILLPQEGIKAYAIKAGKIRRSWSPKAFFHNLFALFIKTPFGILNAFRILFFLSPDIIFSKGGYGTIPATIAGWVLRIPIFLHESDAVPGKANQFAGKFATEIFVSFPHTQLLPAKKIMLVGNPIRRRLLTGSREEATSLFQLSRDRPIILVLGGSQGAQRVNDMLLIVLDEMLEQFEVIHQTGDNNYRQVQREARVVISENNQKYYHPVPFLKETELRHAYAAADFIISRAGSGSIFEIAAAGTPSILIPLPESAQGHQIANAYAYAASKACIILEQGNMMPHFFLQRIKSILSDPKEMEMMSKAARDFAKPEASKVISEYILEYLRMRH